MAEQDDIKTVATSDESRLYFLQIGRAFPSEAELIDACSVMPFACELVAVFTNTALGTCNVELQIEGQAVPMVAISSGGSVSGGSDALMHSDAGPMLEYAPQTAREIDVREKFQIELSDLSTQVENLNICIWMRRSRSNETGEA